jgi:hypothetical protein
MGVSHPNPVILTRLAAASSSTIGSGTSVRAILANSSRSRLASALHIG